jgi:uroporphyrinogen-III synthase
LARAKVARDVIPTELRKLGAAVDIVEAYETIVPQKSRASIRALFKDPKRRPHIIAFTSSSTVKNFLNLAGKGRQIKNIHMASIGPVTSATLRDNGLNPDIQAAQYTIPGLIKAICKNSAHIST